LCVIYGEHLIISLFWGPFEETIMESWQGTGTLGNVTQATFEPHEHYQPLSFRLPCPFWSRLECTRGL